MVRFCIYCSKTLKIWATMADDAVAAAADDEDDDDDDAAQTHK